MTVRKGRCLCGAVSYEYQGPENWVGHCHCESCRRNTSSPYTTFVGVPRTAFRFTGIEPAVYNSSPGVRRLFCRRCGAPVAYDADKFPDEIHFYLASLEDASSAVRPEDASVSRSSVACGPSRVNQAVSSSAAMSGIELLS